MNELDATRAKLKCLEMVEGTGLDWWGVIRHKPTKERLKSGLVDYHPEHIELALDIIEGKPVFEGDELYYIDCGTKWRAKCKEQIFSTSSWNPPKPKTVMVELLVEDAEQIARLCGAENRASTACRKALEEMK